LIAIALDGDSDIVGTAMRAIRDRKKIFLKMDGMFT
jgi:hypothetical protein